MKIKIDRYLIRLLRDNLGYFILLVLIIIIFVYSLSFYQQKNDQNSQSISNIQQQNADYKKRVDLINQQQVLLKESINLDKINLLMTQLIPEKEDMFSIISALNQLSETTRFQVTSYTINDIDPKNKSISITINGEGDRDAFLSFLENYNLGSGRLITIDKIDYSETNAFNIKLKLNFYTSQTNTQSVKTVVNFTEKDKKLIKKIESKTPTASESASGDVDVDINYKVKDKPF